MPSQSRSARQLPRKRGSQNETFRLLPPTRAGEVARRAGEGNNKQCGGRFLRTSPRRGTLSFVTQKFFCFGAINNRRNYWLGIPFCCHIGWVFTRVCKAVSGCFASPLHQTQYGALYLL